MTKEENAAKYAEMQVASITKQIREAYLQGYHQALLDTNKVVSIDGVEYVDLGLPSGTLWSKQPFRVGREYLNVDYSEALNYPIPTEEQWKELIRCCAIKRNEIIAPAPNCQRIGYEFWPKGICGEECNPDGNKFWLKGEQDSSGQAPAMVYGVRSDRKVFNESGLPSELFINNKDILIGIDKHFTGLRLPIFLIKSKSSIVEEET